MSFEEGITTEQIVKRLSMFGGTWIEFDSNGHALEWSSIYEEKSK